MIAAMLMPQMILARTKTDQDSSCNETIARRLESWLLCDIEFLFHEAKSIQERLCSSKKARKRDALKDFDKFMHSGKIATAVQCLQNDTKGGVLDINQKIGEKTVLDILKEKHPPPQIISQEYIVPDDENTQPSHPSIFDKINPSAIKRNALKTHGSHDPSGVDANEWRRFLTTFKASSFDLCKVIAKLAIRVATGNWISSKAIIRAGS